MPNLARLAEVVVVIYCRLSKKDSAQYSLEDQEARCRSFAEQLGWRVAKVYIENGKTARVLRRPVFDQMLQELRPLGVHAVLLYDLDRFMRKLKFQIAMKEDLEARNVELVSIADNGVIDTSTPEGVLQFQLKGMVAEWYSNQLARKVKHKLEYKASQGGWVGPVPLGYGRVDVKTIAPSEQAAAVAHAFQLYASGVHSFTSVADALNAAGWRTRDGQRFGRESVRTILKNRAYLGYVSSGGVEYPGTHPPLIDRETWDACQRVMHQRDTKPGSTSVRAPRGGGLLTEITYCARCGKQMWYHHTATKRGAGVYYYYICSGRSHRTCTAGLCRADHIEAQVLTFVQQLQIPAAWHGDILRYAEELLLDERQPARAQQDRAAIESKLARLAVLFEDGDIPVQTYRQKRDALRRELTALPTPQAVPDLAGALRYLHDFGALVAAADLEQRRALFRQLFSHLYVEGQDLKAITPTGLYLPLVGVMTCFEFGVADGAWLPHPHITLTPITLRSPQREQVLRPR